MEKHTTDKPLILKWTAYGYKVNKPNQGDQELVSKEVAADLLEALKKARILINVAPIIGKEDLMDQIDEAIKKATL